MAVKKMRTKSHKGTKKRVRFTKGGDVESGKMKIRRNNQAHRLIKKSSARKLKKRVDTSLSKTYKKLKSVL